MNHQPPDVPPKGLPCAWYNNRFLKKMVGRARLAQETYCIHGSGCKKNQARSNFANYRSCNLLFFTHRYYFLRRSPIHPRAVHSVRFTRCVFVSV